MTPSPQIIAKCRRAIAWFAGTLLLVVLAMSAGMGTPASGVLILGAAGCAGAGLWLIVHAYRMDQAQRAEIAGGPGPGSVTTGDDDDHRGTGET